MESDADGSFTEFVEKQQTAEMGSVFWRICGKSVSDVPDHPGTGRTVSEISGMLPGQSSFDLGWPGTVPSGKYERRILQHSAEKHAAGL